MKNQKQISLFIDDNVFLNPLDNYLRQGYTVASITPQSVSTSVSVSISTNAYAVEKKENSIYGGFLVISNLQNE